MVQTGFCCLFNRDFISNRIWDDFLLLIKEYNICTTSKRWHSCMLHRNLDGLFNVSKNVNHFKVGIQTQKMQYLPNPTTNKNNHIILSKWQDFIVLLHLKKKYHICLTYFTTTAHLPPCQWGKWMNYCLCHVYLYHTLEIHETFWFHVFSHMMNKTNQILEKFIKGSTEEQKKKFKISHGPRYELLMNNIFYSKST